MPNSSQTMTVPPDDDGRVMAKEPLATTIYDMSCVPKVKPDFADSVLYSVSGPQWKHLIPEMVQLTKEASWRGREKEVTPEDAKLMNVLYMWDRIATDDPIKGWVIRHRHTREMQGFLTYNPFTVWQPVFVFRDEGADALAQKLNSLHKDGDPYNEGVIYESVLEVGLLGSLGGGSMLMRLLYEEVLRLRKISAVIVRPTVAAMGFYEFCGMEKVYPYARFRQKTENDMELQAMPPPTEEDGGYAMYCLLVDLMHDIRSEDSSENQDLSKSYRQSLKDQNIRGKKLAAMADVYEKRHPNAPDLGMMTARAQRGDYYSVDEMVSDLKKMESIAEREFGPVEAENPFRCAVHALITSTEADIETARAKAPGYFQSPNIDIYCPEFHRAALKDPRVMTCNPWSNEEIEFDCVSNKPVCMMAADLDSIQEFLEITPDLQQIGITRGSPVVKSLLQPVQKTSNIQYEGKVVAIVDHRGIPMRCHDVPYWYVESYVPDLHWVELAPLQQQGQFQKGQFKGQKVYRKLQDDPKQWLSVSASLTKIVKKAYRDAIQEVPVWAIGFGDPEEPYPTSPRAKDIQREAKRRKGLEGQVSVKAGKVPKMAPKANHSVAELSDERLDQLIDDWCAAK